MFSFYDDVESTIIFSSIYVGGLIDKLSQWKNERILSFLECLLLSENISYGLISSSVSFSA